MNKKKLITLGAVAIAVLLVAGVVVQRLSARRAALSAPNAAQALPFELTTQDVAPVQTQNFVRSVTISGSLKALDSAFVKAKVAAELKTLLVREGDVVQAGQLLGELDPVEMDLRLRQAERNADAAKAELDISVRNLQNNRALVNQGFISDTALQTKIGRAHV